MKGRLLYTKRVGDTLKNKIKELAEANPDERISLDAEIDVMRITAEQALVMYDAACVTEADKSSPATKAMAVQLLRDSMTAVADIAQKAARVRQISQSTLDLEFLDFMVNQTMRIVQEFVEPDRWQEVKERIKEIQLPDRQHLNAAPAAAGDIRSLIAQADESIPA